MKAKQRRGGDLPLSIRFPAEVRAAIRERAEDEGDSDSGWVRRMVIRALRQDTEAESTAA